MQEDRGVALAVLAPALSRTSAGALSQFCLLSLHVLAVPLTLRAVLVISL